MDPTVTGALIAGGAALIGFAASGWQNNRTIRANLQSARDERFWDKKTELYESIIALLNAGDRAHYSVPLQPAGYQALDALRRALNEHDSAMRLYASQDVANQFGELTLLLRVLSTCSEHFQSSFVGDAARQESTLTDAMSRDLHGLKVPGIGNKVRRRIGRRLRRGRRRALQGASDVYDLVMGTWRTHD
jgi:hypothetical protein